MSSINKAVEAVKKADTISFSGDIVPSDALLLSKIANTTNAKLVCPECYGFSNFINAYKEVSGKVLSSTIDSLKSSDAIIMFGSRVADNHPQVYKAISEAKDLDTFIYMHPIEDVRLEGVSQFIKYEPGSEEGIAALLLEALTRDTELPSNLKEYIEELDIGFLSGESSVSEEELDELVEKLQGKKRVTLVVGSDVFNHQEAQNIAKILGAIEKFANLELLIVEPTKSALLVSQVCNLSTELSGTVVEIGSDAILEGYNLVDIAKEFGISVEPNEVEDILSAKNSNTKLELKDVEELPSFDGVVIYCVDNLQEDKLVGTKQFSMAAKISNGDSVEFKIGSKSFKRVFSIDTSLKGTIALNPTFDMGLSGFTVSSYRFCKIFINKVGSANE